MKDVIINEGDIYNRYNHFLGETQRFIACEYNHYSKKQNVIQYQGKNILFQFSNFQRCIYKGEGPQLNAEYKYKKFENKMSLKDAVIYLLEHTNRKKSSQDILRELYNKRLYYILGNPKAETSIGSTLFNLVNAKLIKKVGENLFKGFTALEKQKQKDKELFENNNKQITINKGIYQSNQEKLLQYNKKYQENKKLMDTFGNIPNNILLENNNIEKNMVNLFNSNANIIEQTKKLKAMNQTIIAKYKNKLGV